MSLLFERALAGFSPADADHLVADEMALTDDDGPRRLNVALTRAGRFLGLVGDWETLRSPGDGRNASADLYRDLHDHVAAVGELREAQSRGG